MTRKQRDQLLAEWSKVNLKRMKLKWEAKDMTSQRRQKFYAKNKMLELVALDFILMNDYLGGWKTR